MYYKYLSIIILENNLSYNFRNKIQVKQQLKF